VARHSTIRRSQIIARDGLDYLGRFMLSHDKPNIDVELLGHEMATLTIMQECRPFNVMS
jgi:hypothetical protein